MATLSYYLKKRKNKEKNPLYLRITHERKSRMVHMDLQLEESVWNKDNEEVRRSYPNYKKINNYLVRKKLEAEYILLELKELKNGYSIDEIKNAIQNSGTDEDREVVIEFFEYAEDIIEDYKSRYSHQYWKSTCTVINKLKSFWKKDQLLFEDITVEFLRKYEVHCIDVRGNKPNTIKSNLKKVRRIFNEAIREGVISSDMYPFRHYTMPSNTVVKTSLSEDEICSLNSVETVNGTRLYDSQNIFMFAYYCWGVRFCDVCQLKWSNIKGDRLIYIMSKTGVRMSVKLSKQAKEILDRYKPSGKVVKEQYIFPFLNHRKDYSSKEYLINQIGSKNALVNKYLKKLQKLAEIDENISFHVARHSFAQRALEKGLRLIEIKELLGHTNIKTTMRYIKSLGAEHLDSTVEGLFN